MSNYADAPKDEPKFALNKRPYPFGSLDIVDGGFRIMPARVESNFPNAFREAVYPDGEIRIQGAYAWTEGSAGGIIWKDLPQVCVDDNGVEIPKE